ncbi:class I SAM-dependent methyltransferase [Brevibacillus sp. SYSU BS000544]|uniref:class I SAM-dependent methyltransferase n=1 Tax=Brevibacillus sp. SYSU BS000544 TaxID=3416443 RepID=UPI003CE575D8
MQSKKSNWNSSVLKQWNHNAADWHSRSENMWESGSRKTVLPLFTKLVRPESGAVLDAGCGDGYGSWKLAVQGYTVTGVDLSEEMVELARERFQPQLALSFDTGDVTQLPYHSSSFAGILAINVIEWTESPLYTLHELSRLLKPGGVLLLGILGPTAAPRTHSYRRLYGEPTIQNTLMPWEASQLALENGFELIVEQPVYKEGVTPELAEHLSLELQQALSFLTLLALRKVSS